MLMMVGALAVAAAIGAPRSAGAWSRLAAGDTLRVVLVVDDTVARRSLLRGARLGAEEASHTGTLFGIAVTLRVESGTTADSTPSIYVVAGDASICSRVMLQSARTKTPVLDVGCAIDDSMRSSTAYSLIPVAGVTATPGDSSRLELWHWSLERFGAEQLNERFRRRFDARMDSPAWTGWLALKIALDAALHARATDGPALLHQLADTRAQYDGQKGRPLRFAAGTRRLVQPLYRVTGRGDAEHVVAEVTP